MGQKLRVKCASFAEWARTAFLVSSVVRRAPTVATVTFGARLSRFVREKLQNAWFWSALACMLALSGSVRAEDASLADAASGPSSEYVPADASTGRLVVFGPMRPSPSARACSFRYPVCVGGGSGDEARVLSALARGPLRLPFPDGSLATGRFDLVFVDSEVEGEIVLEERDVRSPLDRASGWGKLSRRLPPGCALDVAVTRLVVRGLLLRTAPGTDEGSARAEAQAVAELLVPCAAGRAGASSATFQEHPERALVTQLARETGQRTSASFEPALDEHTRGVQAIGAALFYRWVDRGFSTEPGAVLRGLFALRASKTDANALRFMNEPDAFDVLGKSFADKLFEGSKLDDLLVDFALSRSCFGSSAAGGAVAVMADVPKVRVDWDVPWPKAARRLAPREPLEPTGSSYIVVRLEGAGQNPRLRIEADWEEHARMRVAFVKLDRDGREIGRARIAAPPTAHEAQMTVADLEGTSSLVVVTTNLGDTSFHFDPDDGTVEPHGYAVTLAAE
jgi:hypothetical protein